MKTRIYKTYKEFLGRENLAENGVSEKFAEANPDFEKMNISNTGCFDCSRCSGCFRCSGCSDCSRCSDCYAPDRDISFEVPEIPSIHQKIFQSTSIPDALEMAEWHSCETTHCRAGWVVHLAGERGKILENKTSTLFAAMQIYRKSSSIHVSPVRFYDDNAIAMEDIKRCAELEAKQ